MRKRILILILILSLALSGCQLAKPEAEAQEEKDMLVGVFLTEEHLDLFDFDAYFQEHAGELVSGGHITAESLEQYGNRIWAEAVTEGDEHVSYRFPDLDGILFASFRITPGEESQNTYWSGEAHEGICDVSFGHHSMDGGSRLELSGTVYFSDTHPNPCLFFNPVYQTPEGEVYLVAGQGTSFSSGLAGSATHSIKEESKQTENGEETGYTTEISVTMEGVYPARKLVILQMGEENQVLRRQEMAPAEAVEELNPDPGCAYILVEEHTASGVRRGLYQKEDRYIAFFREMENRMATKVQVNIIWPE